MKRNLFVLVLIALPVCLCAQVLTGKVYRAGTNSIIADASVYYGSSMLGTLTNAKGEFSIPARPGKTALIVSCIGYLSETITEYSPDKPLTVYLKPKLHELHEVQIGGSYLSRADEERLFKKEFLGTSDYALSCTILNIADISFSYNKKTGTLKAYADNPLEIENKKLCYHIRCFLDHFIKTPKDVAFAGNYIFSETADAAADNKIKHNRADTYNGSRMEFIRDLWSNSLKKAHYKLLDISFAPLDAYDIVCLNDKLQKVINTKYPVYILHNNSYNHSTSLTQTITDCYIDETGFYDTGLKWGGDMGTQRVGDMLPFEYQPDKAIREATQIADSTNQTAQVNAQKPIKTALNSTDDKTLQSLSLFKSIVLVQNSGLDTRLVVKKWATPIRYKVYGRFGSDKTRSDMVMQKADNLFSQLSQLTGLSIAKAVADSDVNFYIVTEPIATAKGVISPEAMGYLEKMDKTGGEYFTMGEDGFSSMVELVRPANLMEVERQIMNGLGFTGVAEGYSHSIFYDHPYDQPDKIQALDARIIQTFYNPAIKSGMNEQELNDALLKIFPNGKADFK